MSVLFWTEDEQLLFNPDQVKIKNMKKQIVDIQFEMKDDNFLKNEILCHVDYIEVDDKDFNLEQSQKDVIENMEKREKAARDVLDNNKKIFDRIFKRSV